MKEIQLSVADMSCQHCVAAIKEALEGVEEVEEVQVSLESKSARVQARDDARDETLLKAVREAGYTPEIVSS